VATEDQCSACGERNPAGSAFCVFCGTYLGWDEPGRGPAGRTDTGATPVTERPTTATQPAPPSPPQPSPVPSQPAPTPAPPTSSGTPCPNCGQDNPATRRFCGRCGYPLVAATAAATPSRPAGTPQRGWWDPEARAARREYRRSLPPLYRWRRVLVSLGVVVGVVLVLTLTGNNPVGYVQERWRELTGDVQPVDNVTAAARPKGSVAPTYDIKNLPGSREEAWATAWPEGATASGECWESPAAGAIVLRWDEPTRVRGLDVWAGLDADNSDRARQFLPKRLGVTFGDLCVPLDLKSTPDRQRLPFDTKTEVTSLVITVADVYPNSATPAENLVAIGGIEVLHQP